MIVVLEFLALGLVNNSSAKGEYQQVSDMNGQ